MGAIAGILSSILTWLVDKFGSSVVKTTLLYGYYATTWILVSAFYLALLSGFTELFNIVSLAVDKFNSISSGSGGSGCILQAVSHTLGCTGILSGFNNVFPTLMTSIIFLVTVFVNKYLMYLVNKLESQVTSLVNQF